MALALASRVKLEGTSLWPNMDAVMERDIAPSHQYQHRLFRALLARMASEADAVGARLIVVGIPYLPQVYEEIRQSAFAGEQFDPDALSRRVRAYTEDAHATYVDTTPAFRTAVKSAGHWLHYRADAHPTDRKSTRLNSSHVSESRMPSSA